jgi:hypothetical protein
VANRNLTIVARVVDDVSGKLRTINKSLNGFGVAAKKADGDITKFNKTLFSLTAFVGTFERAFKSLGDSMYEGAQFQRVNDQFESLFGTRGEFSNLIDQFTDNFVDQFEAMKAGTDLKRLGIVNNVDQLAELMARAGTAAKLANKTSAEGIKEVSGFLKDGAISHLEFLDVVARTNPALKAQLTILKATGGVLGGVISQQQALRLGMNLLRGATEGSMKGFQDMLDQIMSIQQAFTFLKRSIGSFISVAVGPFLTYLKPLIVQLTAFFDNIRKSDKNLMFFARTIMFTTAAITAFLGVLGSIKLVGLSLTSLGVGIPALTTVIVGLGLAFLGLTNNTDKFVDKLRVFAGFFRGVFQLVHSFLSDPENFAKGIGYMDKSLADLLRKNNLFDLVVTIARLTAVTTKFVSDVGQKLISWAMKLDEIVSKLLGSFFRLFGGDAHKGWSRGLIDSNNKVRDTIVTITAAIISMFGAFKLLRGLGSIFGNIPIIGGLFGGGKGRFGGPTGTKSDPIYVAGGGLMAGGMDWSDVLGGKKTLAERLASLGGLAQKGALVYGGAAVLGGLSNLVDYIKDPTFAYKLGKQTENYGIADWLMHPGNALAATGIGIGGLLGGNIQSPDNAKSNTLIPQMPDSQVDALDALGEQLKTMHGDRRQQFESMVEGALRPNTPGGTQISKDEWAQLMTFAMRKAIDTSQAFNKPTPTSMDMDSAYRR